MTERQAQRCQGETGHWTLDVDEICLADDISVSLPVAGDSM
jgi:hypothetical protein